MIILAIFMLLAFSAKGAEKVDDVVSIERQDAVVALFSNIFLSMNRSMPDEISEDKRFDKFIELQKRNVNILNTSIHEGKTHLKPFLKRETNKYAMLKEIRKINSDFSFCGYKIYISSTSRENKADFVAQSEFSSDLYIKILKNTPEEHQPQIINEKYGNWISHRFFVFVFQASPTVYPDDGKDTYICDVFGMILGKDLGKMTEYNSELYKEYPFKDWVPVKPRLLDDIAAKMQKLQKNDETLSLVKINETFIAHYAYPYYISACDYFFLTKSHLLRSDLKMPKPSLRFLCNYVADRYEPFYEAAKDYTPAPHNKENVKQDIEQDPKWGSPAKIPVLLPDNMYYATNLRYPYMGYNFLEINFKYPLAINDDITIPAGRHLIATPYIYGKTGRRSFWFTQPAEYPLLAIDMEKTTHDKEDFAWEKMQDKIDHFDVMNDYRYPVIGYTFTPTPIPKEERIDLDLYTPEEMGMENYYFDIYDLKQKYPFEDMIDPTTQTPVTNPLQKP